MSDETPEEKEKLQKAIEKGINLTGSTVGATAGAIIGTWVGGPIGTASGAAVGHLLALIIEEASDFISRKLSKAEEVRAGASVSYAVYKIRERLELGHKIRNDDFFTPRFNNKSKAEEIFEGVLIKSQLQYQEKKIRFISNIFANAAFREDLTIEELNHVVNVADRLSYRQLCILSLITKEHPQGDDYEPWNHKVGLIFPSEAALVTSNNEIFPYPHKNYDFYYIYKEFMNLKELDLMGSFFGQFPVNPEKLPENLKQRESKPKDCVFTYSFSRENCSLAFRYSDIMDLQEIPDEDITPLKAFIVPSILLDVKPQRGGPPLVFISKPDFLVSS